MGAGRAARVIELDEAVGLADAQRVGRSQHRGDFVDRPHEIIGHHVSQRDRLTASAGPFRQAQEVIAWPIHLGHQHRLGPSLKLIVALEVPHPDADPLELILLLGDDLHPPTLPNPALTASEPPDPKRA